MPLEQAAPKRIVVYGSINIDLVTRVSRHPQPGETIHGYSFETIPGGKGANQAAAAARLGVPVGMIGRVGDDSFGEILKKSLDINGVDISGVSTQPNYSSGTATIIVEDSGENTIIVVPGANGLNGLDDEEILVKTLAGASVLLLQLEIPLEAVLKAARLARQQGVRVILDPAPAPVNSLPPELYALVDILTPNESEASALTGFEVYDPVTAATAARLFIERGVKDVIIKMGSKGIYWSNGQDAKSLPAFQVVAVDTVGAGDAFNGTLAVALHEGHSLIAALLWGLAGGGLSTTKKGAQAAMPGCKDLESLLSRFHSIYRSSEIQIESRLHF